MATIKIDNELIKQVTEINEIKSLSKSVEEALIFYVNFNHQKDLRNYRGKLNWTGDLDTMREFSFDNR
jgi:hypothetical protein